MPTTFQIAVFNGDGIGPEVMAPAVDLLRILARGSADYDFEFETLPAGAAHFAQAGESLPQTSLDKARAADAILLSAMGLPDIRYPDGTEISPQIELRKELNLFAGVRPVRIASGALTPLALPTDERVDFVLVRESTEGLFHTQGCGHVGQDLAEETLRITRATSEKLFHFSFDLARQRKATGLGSGRVTCVDKANVFRAFAFFREIFDDIARAYPDITADHAYVDATALSMVQNPQNFDVLVTENMFGDILSDLGAGLMGGLGLAPSGDIGTDNAVFQPCHGSAPDIAGQGVANPMAMILSSVMMMDWLGNKHKIKSLCDDAHRLQSAVDHVIANRNRLTPDLGGKTDTIGCFHAVKAAL